MSEWKTIDTAPRCNTTDYIIGFVKTCNGGGVVLIRNTFTPDDKFNTASPQACWIEKGHDWPTYPTHWMPLPEPPCSPDCSR